MSVIDRVKGLVFLNDPTWSEQERDEAQLKRRLDIFFCSYISISAIVKYLDQTNISNAYVSGMQEDLGLYGNQLNLFTTYFNIGYIICIPISSFLMNSVIRPSIWLPTLELLWGIGTGCLASAKNETVVYGIRFFVGFCEGTAWPGTMVLLLSWYTPSEVGKRLAIYQSATSLGGIFSGALQSALYTNLNGRGGLSGWRWLFVINAIITVSVAGWGYIGCPDYPNRPNPWSKWLRPKDVDVALARSRAQKKVLPKKWTLATLKSVVTRPQNWAIWVAYTILGQGGTGTGYFNLWLKSLKNADGTARYTVSQLNTIPIAASCITIVSLLTFLSLSDKFRIQWPFLLGVCVNGIIFAGILAKWNVPDAAKFASFLLLNFCGCYQNLFISWVGVLARHSAEERSFIIAAFVVTYYVITAGVPIVVWPAAEAPHYRIGWNYAVAMYSAGIFAVIAVIFFDRRQQRIDALLEDAEQVHTPENPQEGSFDDNKSTPEQEVPTVPFDEKRQAVL